MGIEFLKNENIFHLSGGDVSYILKIYKNAFQCICIEGKGCPIQQSAGIWNWRTPYRRKKNCLREQNPDDPMFLKVPEVQP